ncbi:hypothetical protein LTS08_007832 [Lithohypha guttulata]|nr:hypothetical protein LTS08_007832 [Lithohypha guttulata]
MDPLSIAAACVGLLSGLTTVSTKIRSLTIDANNTSAEVIALQKELDSFQRSLGMFYGSGMADSYPEHLRPDLDTIVRECQHVVREIDTLLDKVRSAHIAERFQWSFTIRDEVVRLHRNLEGHKSAITIAIAFASMSITNGIKSDTSSIRSKTARIPEIQNQLALLISAIQSSDDANPLRRQPLNLAMERFLQEAYTESVSGTLRRAGSTTSHGTRLYSNEDPFQDQDSVLDVRVVEQAGLEVVRNFSADDKYGASASRSLSQESFAEQRREPASANASRVLKPLSYSQVEQHLQKPNPENLLLKLPAVSRKNSALSIPFLKPRVFSSSSDSVTILDRISPGVTKEWFNALTNQLQAVRVVLDHHDKDILERSRTYALQNNNAKTVDAFQEAMRLRDEGDMFSATEKLKDLAELGNVPSQNMYALSLRHGWGCPRNDTLALAYHVTAAGLSIMLENSIQREEKWFTTSTKDQLRLALFEIASSKRWGWGCAIDAKDAKAFYAAASNLDDVDAMQELAWCCLTGFGGKKDKFVAAQYLRLAEKSGSKVIGNTWIWKEKYNPKSSS